MIAILPSQNHNAKNGAIAPDLEMGTVPWDSWLDRAVEVTGRAPLGWTAEGGCLHISILAE
jgi:hypothetical protein